MPNKNYLRGRRLEYEVVEQLRKFNPNGFAQRMAGSHSPFDVVGYNPDLKTILLVQCKTKVTKEKKSVVRAEEKTEEGWRVTTYKLTKYIRRK